MAENKKSVLLYCDIIHTVEKLDNETAGILFKHYLRYVNDLNPKTDNHMVDVVFEPIKHQLKRDLKKYQEKCNKNRDNVRKRWNKKDTVVYNRTNRNTNHTDKDTDIDKDTDNVYKYLKENIKEKIELFEMQNKKSFPDWNNFIENFNNKVIEEKLDFDVNILFARLKRLNVNWDKTPKKEKKKKMSSAEIIHKKYGLS